MNCFEELKADYEYNQQHSIFADVDDDILGKRCQGYYLKDVDVDKDGNTVFSVVFDNGHHYVTNGIDASRVDDIPGRVFIHKYLEKVVYDYVRQVPFPVKQDVICSQYEVSVESFIRMVTDRNQRIVSITNIFIPRFPEYQYHNYGKDLIALIYQQCKTLGYKLWLVDMVEGFYNRMVKRGATVIDENDIVEINDETDLSKR